MDNRHAPYRLCLYVRNLKEPKRSRFMFRYYYTENKAWALFRIISDRLAYYDPREVRCIVSLERHDKGFYGFPEWRTLDETGNY